MEVARVAPDWPMPSLMRRRRALGDRITYIGFDVHEDGIVVAVAEGGRRGEMRKYRRIAHAPGGVAAAGGQLGRQQSCSSAIRRDRAAMAYNASCRRVGTNALWWRHR